MTRLEKFIQKIPADVTACLITGELNLRYLSGVNYTDGFLLISREGSKLFADSRYIEVAKRDAAKGFEVILLDKGRSVLIKEALKEGSVIGYEDNIMTCAELEALKTALSEYKFIACGGISEELRNIKDEYEKECVVKAQRMAENALDNVLGRIGKDLLTETDVALELEYLMRKQGADGIAFDTIAVSGAASSMPHGVPQNRPLEKGFLTMDFGAKFNGYCSDMTRTVCLGKPTEEMKKVYNTVLEAQCAAIDFIKAGEKCADADKVARDIIYNAGYKGCFGHSLGHGVGLYIHERISVSPKSTGILIPGNIITVEPGIYLEGQYGVRIEDMLYITENGKENLTKAPKELIVI
jgi:Xaa-Pro aminopeptidase